MSMLMSRLSYKSARCSQLENRIKLDLARTARVWLRYIFSNSMKMLPVLPSHLHLDNTSAQHHNHHSHHNRHSHSPSQGSTTPKRSSSMIFRIEHLLPRPPITTSAPTTPPTTLATSVPSSVPATIYQLQSTAGVSSTSISSLSPNNAVRRLKSNRSAGVYLKHFAPKDTISETISSLALMSSSNSAASGSSEQTASDQPPRSSRTYCSIMEGILRLTPTIMRKVKLSEDIHSYNALFEIYNGDVRLRTVRDIAREEELIAWFDEEVTILMSVPFLTPMNIQGNNRYTCHICHLTFETPNPLKIHLALACGRHTLDILWIRLHYTLKSTAMGQHSLPFRLVHHLPPISPGLRTPESIPAPSSSSASSSSNATTISTISPSRSRLSAFKPISSAHASSSTVTVSSTPSYVLSPPQLHGSHLSNPTTAPIPTFMPSTGISQAATLSSMNLLHPPVSGPLNAAAQIEAIVSNMGASKQGHLCIYCGKVYSRKYGLKIHIRTHTGFKPLKCKFCLRPFGDPSNLNKHVRLHLQSASASSTSSENVEGYKCHMCNKTLARRRDLQRHIESRHNNVS